MLIIWYFSGKTSQGTDPSPRQRDGKRKENQRLRPQVTLRERGE